MLYERTSTHSPAEVETLLREAAQRHRFGVLNSLDLGSTLRSKGVDFESEVRVIDICNPNFAAEALNENLAVATVLPCRIAIYATAEGSRIATVQPSDLFAATGLEGDRQLMTTVGDAIRAIIDECSVN